MATRAIAVVLCGAILVHVSGCTSADHRADEAWSRLNHGMTKEEVSAAIGAPDCVLRPPEVPARDRRTVETWRYDFASPSVVAEVVGTVVVVFVVVLLVVVAAVLHDGGGLGGLGGGWGGGGSARASGEPACELRVEFDGTGRLLNVSRVERKR